MVDMNEVKTRATSRYLLARDMVKILSFQDISRLPTACLTKIPILLRIRGGYFLEAAFYGASMGLSMDDPP